MIFKHKMIILLIWNKDLFQSKKKSKMLVKNATITKKQML